MNMRNFAISCFAWAVLLLFAVVSSVGCRAAQDEPVGEAVSTAAVPEGKDDAWRMRLYEENAVDILRKARDTQTRYHNANGTYATSVKQAKEFFGISVLPEKEDNGYTFTLLQADDTSWSMIAKPITPGRTGNRTFFVDETNVIRVGQDETGTPL